ncbi:MAG: hypothetical protein WCC37_02130, partial [Candidatus Sulfotelmatobacter sp.]
HENDQLVFLVFLFVFCHKNSSNRYLSSGRDFLAPVRLGAPTEVHLKCKLSLAYIQECNKADRDAVRAGPVGKVRKGRNLRPVILVCYVRGSWRPSLLEVQLAAAGRVHFLESNPGYDRINIECLGEQPRCFLAGCGVKSLGTQHP